MCSFLFIHYISVQFSCSVVSDSLQLHELQHARSPRPLPTPRVYSNSRPLSRLCHPAISSYVVPFSSYLQSFPASGSFPLSQFFASGGQSIGVSASAPVLPMNIQDWFPLYFNKTINKIKPIRPWPQRAEVLMKGMISVSPDSCIFPYTEKC